MLRLLTSQTCFSRSCGSDGTTLHGLPDVTLKGAVVIAWGGQPWECRHPSHQPKCGGIDSNAHAGITTLQANEGGDRDPQPLGPRSLGLPAANTGYGQVFAQGTQGLCSRRGHDFQGL
jgi:hypothetical protein